MSKREALFSTRLCLLSIMLATVVRCFRAALEISWKHEVRVYDG